MRFNDKELLSVMDAIDWNFNNNNNNNNNNNVMDIKKMQQQKIWVELNC